MSGMGASQEVLGEAQATALNLISCSISVPGLTLLTVSKSAGLQSSPERLQVTGLFANRFRSQGIDRGTDRRVAPLLGKLPFSFPVFSDKPALV